MTVYADVRENVYDYTEMEEQCAGMKFYAGHDDETDEQIIDDPIYEGDLDELYGRYMLVECVEQWIANQTGIHSGFANDLRDRVDEVDDYVRDLYGDTVEIFEQRADSAFVMATSFPELYAEVAGLVMDNHIDNLLDELYCNGSVEYDGHRLIIRKKKEDKDE